MDKVSYGSGPGRRWGVAMRRNNKRARSEDLRRVKVDWLLASNAGGMCSGEVWGWSKDGMWGLRMVMRMAAGALCAPGTCVDGQIARLRINRA
jgi:hypothetical protein